jgi:hypothetical protein
MTTQVDCVKDLGSHPSFPDSWQGTSHNPVNTAGRNPETYGTFGISGEMTLTP